jgi:acyl-coenzyme A thioesterase PaaI-like protein
VALTEVAVFQARRLVAKGMFTCLIYRDLEDA